MTWRASISIKLHAASDHRLWQGGVGGVHELAIRNLAPSERVDHRRRHLVEHVGHVERRRSVLPVLHRALAVFAVAGWCAGHPDAGRGFRQARCAHASPGFRDARLGMEHRHLACLQCNCQPFHLLHSQAAEESAGDPLDALLRFRAPRKMCSRASARGRSVSAEWRAMRTGAGVERLDLGQDERRSDIGGDRRKPSASVRSSRRSPSPGGGDTRPEAAAAASVPRGSSRACDRRRCRSTISPSALGGTGRPLRHRSARRHRRRSPQTGQRAGASVRAAYPHMRQIARALLRGASSSIAAVAASSAELTSSIRRIVRRYGMRSSSAASTSPDETTLCPRSVHQRSTAVRASPRAAAGTPSMRASASGVQTTLASARTSIGGTCVRLHTSTLHVALRTR